MILTRSAVTPEVHGHEVRLLGVMPGIFPVLLPCIYCWGVYPLPPTKSNPDLFCEQADRFISGISLFKEPQ